MTKLRYRAAATLATAAMAVGFSAPVGATGYTNTWNDNHNPSSGTTNLNSNNTFKYTSNYTKTTNTTVNSTHTFNNSGIVQTQLPSGSGHDHHDSSSAGTQTAVQGNNSGVYNVKISQSQETEQTNESSNVTCGQDNSNQNYNGSLFTKSQTNTQTNLNTQTQNQSNNTSQTQNTSQSAQGVVVQ